jgi:small-conductance mechanosensitive channel
VKDIVSGIFFMADDAFRLGEYIDTGKLKGTVERITLRAVQLRHQNGPVHTVPFGTLNQITNFSRDWATMKFTLRLDRDADIETARKAIKKLGQHMLDDPELGPELLLPLKMQGVQEIADGAIVVRCKFTARPNKPTWVQREALKRIHRALTEAGVAFASNAVTVRARRGEPAPPPENVAAAARVTASDNRQPTPVDPGAG